MSELGSASGRIEIDVGGALSAIDKVHNGVQSLGDAGGNVSSRFNILKNGILGFGTAMIAPMTMGLRGAVSLEQGIADVNASLGGLDASTLDALSDMFIEVGSASRYSATEVAAISDELAKAGFDADTLLNGMTASVVELAQATGDGLGPATDGMIQAFAMWAPEIVGTELAITDAARAADILTIAANQSAGGIGDVIGGLRNAGPALASVGMGFDEAAAAIAMFTNYGYSGDEIGTKLSRTLTFLSKPTDEAAAAMEQYGIKAFDAQGKFIGFPALFDQLQTGFAGVGDEARLAALKTIFGAEAFDLMNIAIETGGDPLREFTGEMEKTGVAAEQSALRMDTLGAQFEELMESTQGFLTSLVNGLIPALRLLVDTGNAVVNVLMKIPQPIKTVIGAVAGLMAGIAAANAAMRSSQAISALLGINMGGLGAAMVSLLPIFAAVGAAVGALYLAWRSNFLGIRDAVETFRQVWDNLTDSVVNNPLSRTLSATSAALRTFDVGWLDSLADKLTGLSMAFHDFMGAFGSIGGTQKVDIEVGGDDKILEKIANPDAADGFDYFVRLQNADGSFDEFGQILESYTDESDPNIAHIKIKTDDGEYWTTIDNTTGEIGTGTIEVEADTKDARKNIDRLNDGLDEMDKTLRKRGLDGFADGLQSVRRFAGDVARVVRDLRYNFDQFRSAGVGPVTSALYALGAVFPGLRSYIEPVTQAISTLTGAFADARARGMNPVQAALEALGDTFPVVEGVVASLQSIVESFTDAWGHLTDAVELFFDGKWSEGFENIKLAAEDAWDGIREGLGLAADLAVAFADWVLDVGVPTVTGWIIDAAGNVWEALKAAAGWVWDGLVALGGWTLETAVPAVTGWIADAAGDVWGWIKTTAGWAWSGLAELGAWTINTAIPTVTGWVKGAASNAWSFIKSAAAWAWDGIADLGAWTLEVATPAIRFLSDIVQDIYNALPNIVVELKNVVLAILSWTVRAGWPPIDEAIEDAVGRTFEYGIHITLRLLGWDIELGEGNPIQRIKDFIGSQGGFYTIAAGLLAIAAIPISVPFALSIGAITGTVGLAVYLANQLDDYFKRNPLAQQEVTADLAMIFNIIGLPEAKAAVTGFWDEVQIAWDAAVAAFDMMTPSFESVATTLTVDLIDVLNSIIDQINGVITQLNAMALVIEGFTGIDIPEFEWLDRIKTDADNAKFSMEGLGKAIANIGASAAGNALGAGLNIQDAAKLPFAGGNLSETGNTQKGAMSGLSSMMQGIRDEADRTSQALTTFSSNVGTAMTTSQTSITTFVGATIGVMGGWTVGIQTQVNSAMDTLRTRVSGATAGAKGSVVTFVADTIGVMGGWTTGIRTQVNSAMDTLRTRVSGATAGAKGSVVTFVADTIGVMGGWSGGFQTIVNRAMSGMLTAIQTTMQTATTAVSVQSSAWSTIVSSRAGAMSAAGLAVGQAAGAGVAQGMLNALGAVTAAANAIVNQVDRALNAAAQVGSPARRFFPHGGWITKGVAKGQTTPEALRALRSAADTVMSTLDRAFAGASPPTLASVDLMGAGRYGTVGAPAYLYPHTPASPVVNHYHETRVYAVRSQEWVEMVRQVEDAPQRSAQYQSEGFSDALGIGD